MLLQFRKEIEVPSDPPVDGIRAFVELLRQGAIDTDRARLELSLVSTSARGLAAIAQFQPQRAAAAPFAGALTIIEELLGLNAMTIKSLRVHATARDFRWRGSAAGSSARAALLDDKSRRRKRRFSCFATLSIEAVEIDDPAIEVQLRAIETATSLRFELEQSNAVLLPAEPGRATADELLLTALTWNEIVERAGRALRSRIDYRSVPCVMTELAAIARAASANGMRAARIDFRRMAQRWVKQDFPGFKPCGGPLGGAMLARPIAAEAVVGLAVNKMHGPLGRMFRVSVAGGLTSRRFALAPDRPAWFEVDLFRLFGIGPVPLVWVYSTEEDLADTFAAASRLLQPALEILAVELPALVAAHGQSLTQFAGPRHLSAREAYELAAPQAHQWAEDTMLFRINSTLCATQGYELMQHVHPSMLDTGRSGASGGWCLQFHSRTRQETLHVTVPCYGPVSETGSAAPSGSQWPSEVDQAIHVGWIDSTQVLPTALEIARRADPGATLSGLRLQSRARAQPVRIPAQPMRDGMFDMETVWQIFFLRHDQTIQLPAYEPD